MFLTEFRKYQCLSATFLAGLLVLRWPELKNHHLEESKFTCDAWYFSCALKQQPLLASEKFRFDFNL
jgi:hypothetical protein